MMRSVACESGAWPRSWKSTDSRSVCRNRSRSALASSSFGASASKTRVATAIAPRPCAYRVCVAPGNARSAKPSCFTLRSRWYCGLSTSARSSGLISIAPWMGSRMCMRPVYCNRVRGPLFLSVAAFRCACASRQRPDAFEADLLLRGGPIFLADSAGTTSRALAIRLARVVAHDADAEALVGRRTRVIDLRGRLVTPGMNDAHCHLGAGGLGLLEVDLRGSTSLAEIERRVAEGAKSAAPGEWITGRGWDQTRLPS